MTRQPCAKPKPAHLRESQLWVASVLNPRGGEDDRKGAQRGPGLRHHVFLLTT
jgi:hypothetical protein